MLYSGEHAVHPRRNLEVGCSRDVRNKILSMAAASVGDTVDMGRLVRGVAYIYMS